MDFWDIQFWGKSPKNRTKNWKEESDRWWRSIWMRTPRSPSWANRPNQPFFNQKSDEKQIFEIFNFEGKVRKIGQKIGRKNRAGDGGPYGCEPYALPDWATGPNQQFQKRNRRIKQYEIIDVAENRTLCAPSWAIGPFLTRLPDHASYRPKWQIKL